MFLTPNGPVGNGDIFITPTGDTGAYANGAEILSRSGKVIWFHPAPSGESDFDFRTQTYDGQPVLTFVQGKVSARTATAPTTSTTTTIRRSPRVSAGNGLTTDIHEFFITPWNTALITAVSQQAVNLGSIGGLTDQQVLEGSVQEIDIKTGKVLFQWNAQDHIPYSDSDSRCRRRPAHRGTGTTSTPCTWARTGRSSSTSRDFVDDDGRQPEQRERQLDHWRQGVDLQAGRRTRPDVERRQRPVRLAARPRVARQRRDLDLRRESAGTANTGQNVITTGAVSRSSTSGSTSRPIRPRWSSPIRSPRASPPAHRNAQPLPGGGAFVGWGNLNYISQFDGAGNLLFNAEFPTGVNTYRAYFLPRNPARSGLRQVLTGATSATEHSGSGPLLGRAPPVAGWRSAASGPRPAQPLSGVRYCFLL